MIRSVFDRWLILALIVLTSMSFAQAQDREFSSFGPYEFTIGKSGTVALTLETDLDEISTGLATLNSEDPLVLEAIRPFGATGTSSQFIELTREAGTANPAPYLASIIVNTFHNLERDYSGRRSELVELLFPEPDLSDLRLTVKIFSDRDRYDAWASRSSSLHQPRALFDPRSNTVGAYFNPRLLKYFAYQASWEGYNDAYFAGEMVGYFEHLLAEQLGHEIYHFLQSKSSSPLFSLNAMKEGTATYAGLRLSERSNILSLVKTKAGLSSSDDESCESVQLSGRLISISEMEHYLRAASYIETNPDFSVLKFVFDNNSQREFARRGRDGLLDYYSLSFVAVHFLASLGGAPAQDFVDAFSERRQSGLSDELVRKYARFDQFFNREIKAEITADFIAKRTGTENTLSALTGLTQCLSSSPPDAYIWGQVANMHSPSSAMVALELGDTMFKSFKIDRETMSFLRANLIKSLDFYALSLARLETGDRIGNPICTLEVATDRLAERIRTHARLGDVLIAFGDIENAKKHLQCATKLSRDAPTPRPMEILPLEMTIRNAETLLQIYERADFVGLARHKEVHDFARKSNLEQSEVFAKILSEGFQTKDFASMCMQLNLVHVLMAPSLEAELMDRIEQLAPEREYSFGPWSSSSGCGAALSIQ